MTADRWAAEHVPEMTGRTVVVTGANSGIGYHTARMLARAGAAVIIACRDRGRGQEAVATMDVADVSQVSVMELDLSDLSSVESFSDNLCRRVDRLDVLVNNAGVMAIRRELTVDGFERQLATNHLGHAALTGRLMPLLGTAAAARVVTVTSFLARSARIRLDDLQGESAYDPWSAYGQSKLANLLFGLELARRCAGTGTVRSVVVHPGYARTRLVANGPASSAAVVDRSVLALGGALVAQSAAAGALPSVMAAADPTVGNGTFLVPRGPGHLRGRPRPARPPAAGRNEQLARDLWDRTEQLTGVVVDRP